MSPAIRTLAIAIIVLSPLAAAAAPAHGDKFEWPQSCAASCVVTVTTTVTELSACSAISSSIQTSLANATSTSTYGHHKHFHHHNSIIDSLTMNSTSVMEATSTLNSTSAMEPTSAAVPISTGGLTNSSSTSNQHYRHYHTSSSQAVIPTTSSVPPTSTFALANNNCHHNNCLRQFIRNPEVAGFCETFTADAFTATTGLPDYVSQCHGEPSRISSACSCIATGLSFASSTPIVTTRTDSGNYTSATTSPSASFQTSNSIISGVCPAASVFFKTSTTTVVFVSTITLGEASTLATSTIPTVSDLTTAFTISGTSGVLSTTV